MDRHGPHAAPSGRPEGKPVGEVARATGIAAHVLRHWEDAGVLVPARDAQGHRRYTDADVAVARGIRRAQQVGLSLPQIREFLSATEEGREQMLRDHLATVGGRIDELTTAAATVERVLAAPVDPACPYAG